MRKLPALVAVLLAAAVGFAISTLYTSVKRAAAGYVDSVEAAGEYRAAFESVGVGLFPVPAVKIRGLEIEDANLAGADNLVLQVPEVRVRPRLLPMLVGLARVAAVELRAPRFTVRRLATGRVSTGPWMERFGGENGMPIPAPLRVRDGTLVWAELNEDPPVQWVSQGMDLELDADEDGALHLDLSLVPTGEASSLGVHGSLQPTGETAKGVRVDLDFRMQGVRVEQTHVLPVIGDLRFVDTLDLEGEAHGFAGGRRTESVPAEKLTITAKGRGTLAAKDVRAPVDLDLLLSDKEGKLRFDKAKLSWNGIDATLTGWTRHLFDQSASLRLEFEGADSDRILAQFGLPDRWRPRAVLAGEIRLEGSLNRPLMQYGARADSMRMDFYDGYPIEVGPSAIKGILLQTSADFSAVVNSPTMRIGNIKIEPATFGIRYWRDKLTVNSMDVGIWDGLATVSARYERLAANTVEVAGLFDDLDASAALTSVFPRFEPDISGRMDAIVQVGGDDDGTWAMGRIGIHGGKASGTSLVRDVFESIASRPGLSIFLDPGVTETFAGSLGGEDTAFRSLKFDFRSRQDGFDLGSVRIRLDGLGLRGFGSMDAAGRVDVEADMALQPRLVQLIVRGAPDLASLVSADGSMHIPVHLYGRLAALTGEVGERFLEAAATAVSGEAVSPAPQVGAGPELDLELPSLEERYGR